VSVAEESVKSDGFYCKWQLGTCDFLDQTVCCILTAVPNIQAGEKNSVAVGL